MLFYFQLALPLGFAALGRSAATRSPSSIRTTSTSPTVSLGYATYEGVREAGGVDTYLGMRYAAPPLGDLRFRGPRDPYLETETQQATAYAPICIGTDQNVTSNLDEDCLYVNVFAPSNATADSKLPVWLYIQGGGYRTNSNANYNGSEVVRQSGQNIVFVNFNYRVGLLGFLASERVREDGDLNVGLLDQRKLLLWVQKYIHHFGGDPSHVVIHGTSAGAGSVSYHLAAYGGRDDRLFVGAIAQSPFWPTAPTVDGMEFQYEKLLNQTGCDGSEEPLTCLRSLDLSSLIPFNTAGVFPGATGNAEWYWLPVEDGDLIRGNKWDLFDNGQFIKVPLLVANDNNEGSNFAPNASTESDLTTFFTDQYPRLSGDQLQDIVSMYPLMDPLPLHGAWFPSASAAYGDATFICPGKSLSASMARYFSPGKVWAYRCYITSASTVAGGKGTPHTFEMPAILGTDLGQSIDASWFNDNAASIPITMNYYISFIRALDPNTYRFPASPVWESWGTGAGRILHLETNATRMEGVTRNVTRACSLWDDLSDTMEV